MGKETDFAECLRELGVRFTMEEGAWTPTFVVECNGGEVITIEIWDWDGEETPFVVSVNGAWPTRFGNMVIASNIVAKVACHT